jgi:hypothetical protein
VIDITGAEFVEVRIRRDGTVLWLDVAGMQSTHIDTPPFEEGATALRICRIQNINVVDDRDRPHSDRLHMTYTKSMAIRLWWAVNALSQLPSATDTEKRQAKLDLHIIEHEGTALWGREWWNAID